MSVPNLHLDYETYSEVDLKTRGQYRYAEDKSSEILIMAVSLDDGPVYSWDAINGGDQAIDLYKEAVLKGYNIWAHNAQFEIAITSSLNQWGIPKLHQWLCTAALCRIAGLPDSLEKAGQALNLNDETKKDYQGKALIRKFSIPDKKGKRTFPQDDPKAFQDFVAYCRKDVIAEKAIHKRLIKFADLLEGEMRETWELDKILNLRGIPINTRAVENARKKLTEENHKIAIQFKSLTGLNPTQNTAFKNWMVKKGYEASDLQGQTIKEELEKGYLSPTCEEALELFQKVSYASTKKIHSMHNTVCRDGRVRGCFMYHGANTGRWSAKLIQPQNFKRPEIKNTDTAYELICEGNIFDGELEMIWGDPIKTIGSCVRHFIHIPGQKFLDADFSAIEARIVCWLADEKDALQQYREGFDRYKVLASSIFNIPLESVNSIQRWIGKGGILGCGYGIGWEKFKIQKNDEAKIYGIPVEITDDLAKKTVYGWRETHPQVVKLWYALNSTCIESIATPNKRFHVGKCDIITKLDAASKYRFLIIRLPSGRKLFYPDPQIDPNGKFGPEVTYWGKIPMSTRYGRIKLYGGKILENISQAVGGDFMFNGLINTEREGFEPFMVVHDQELAQKNVDLKEKFISLMTKLPDWATGFPLAAEGGVVDYYTKD